MLQEVLLTPPAPVPCPLPQNRQWVAELPKHVPWLSRGSPYYNLISGESQIWQGGWVAPAPLGNGVPGDGTSRACPPPAYPARPPTHNPAELNLAYSQHEIVSDYVRPTLMWLEAKGRANLAALVDQFSLNGTLRCLTETQEGCPTQRQARALLR